MGNFSSSIRSYPKTFWTANVMELFERWAWYGIYSTLAVFLTNSAEDGGLSLSQSEKGMILALVPAFLYFLPIITGALADKIGYKKMLAVAYVIMAIGYAVMGMVEPGNTAVTLAGWSVTFQAAHLFMYAFLFMAVGAAIFKPIVSATIAKTTTSKTASLGFGIFYMIVNVGGFIGPTVTAILTKDNNFGKMFWISAASILVNLVLVTLFFKEPDRNEKTSFGILATIGDSFRNIFRALLDVRLVVLLFIFIFFWTLFNQLYVSLPNFIVHWVDTEPLYSGLESISQSFAAFIGTADRKIPFQMLTNVNALSIIFLQIVISTFVMRFRAINTMTSGILVCALGLTLAFLTNNVTFVVLGIFIFSLGEMASSPKFTEYIGSLAPQDKKALYMGTSFLPHFIGNFLAGYIAGDIYQRLSDKVQLSVRYAQEQGMNIPPISDTFTQKQFMEAVQQRLPDGQELTQVLWETYHPDRFMYVLAGLGAFTVISLVLYDKFMLKGKNPEQVHKARQEA
ncbi:MAG: MFS transporter [Cytophagales bacterium]|nr:MFS transporter [Cytophagales bacterium]